MFLPWSMMALPEASENRTMGIWVDRKVAHMDERYGWPALPFTEPRFMSALQPVALPGLATKQQLAIFPFASATHDEAGGEQEYRVGADVAWRPTPNLQLTASLNPDFGAVESDDVVVNLTAFETFFAEKRLFFLEGTEIFVTTPRSDLNRFRSTRRGGGARATPKTFTPEPTTLVNTRRIGGPPKHLSVPSDVDVAPWSWANQPICSALSRRRAASVASDTASSPRLKMMSNCRAQTPRQEHGSGRRRWP